MMILLILQSILNSKAMKTLKKHNLDEDEIKRLQEQTQHNVNVQREGVLNKIKPGAGHRLTRYAYKLISDWSDADPRHQR